MRLYFLICTMLIGILGCRKTEKSLDEPSAVKLPTEQTSYACSAAKEFITTTRFLHEDKDFKLDLERAQDIAFSVAKGCSGAARRFIGVAKMLVKAGGPHSSAIPNAVKVSLESDAYAQAYELIFRRAFLSKYLDLDFMTSLQLAESLSDKHKIELTDIGDQYDELVRFCLAKEGLAESRPQCAQFVQKVISYNRPETPEQKASEAYIETLTFLRDDRNGPQMASFEAQKLANELLALAPRAGHNFKESFLFAQSEEGLGLNRNQAIQAASTVASATVHPQN